MALLGIGMFAEFRGHLREIDALGDHLVVSVPENAQDLGGERLVQELERSMKVERVVLRYGSALNRLPRFATYLPDVVEIARLRFG
jgi:hypothetical protein